MIALNALLKAQFAVGAFPQVWTGPVGNIPGKAAGFPDYDWRTEGRIKNYWDCYTLNDGLAGYVSTVLMEAYEIYEDERYQQAVLKLGDFLIRPSFPIRSPPGHSNIISRCSRFGLVNSNHSGYRRRDSGRD